ncbi:unnamed protein product [Caretta caretta]
MKFVDACLSQVGLCRLAVVVYQVSLLLCLELEEKLWRIVPVGGGGVPVEPVAVPGVGGEAVEVTDTVVESVGRSVVVLPCEVGCVERSVVPSVVVRPEGGRVEPDEVCGRVTVAGGIVPVGGAGVPVEPVAVPGVGGEAVEVSETVVESGGRSVVVLPCEVGCVERSVVPSVVVRPEGGWVEPDEVCGRVPVAGRIVPVGSGGVPVEPVAVPGVGGEAVEVTDTVVESGGRSVVVLPCDVGCVERSVVPSVVVCPEGGRVEPDEVCGRVPVTGGIVLVGGGGVPGGIVPVGGGGVPVEPVAVPGVGGEAVEVTDTVVESGGRSVVVLPCDVGCVERSVVPSVVVRPEGGRVEPDEGCGRVPVAGGIVPVGSGGVPGEPVAVPGVGGEAVEVTETVVESGGRSVVVLPCEVGCVERECGAFSGGSSGREEGVEPDEVCGRVPVAGGIVPVGGGGVPGEPVAVPGVGGEAVEVTDTVVESVGRSVVVLPCDVGCVERSVVPSVVVRPEGGRVEPDEVCGRVPVAGRIVPVGGGGVPVEPVAVPGVGGEAVEVTDTVVESVGRSVVVLPCEVGCVERSVVPSVVVRPEGGRVEPDEVCGRVPVTGGIVLVGGGGVPVEPVAVPGVGGEAVEVSETVVESGGRSVVVLPCEVGCVERSVVPSVVVRPEGGRVEPDEVCGRVPVAGRIVPVGGGGVPVEPVAVPGVGGEAVEVTDTVVESGGRSVVVLPCDVGCVGRSVVPSVVVCPEGGRVEPDEVCGRVPVAGRIVPVGGGGVPVEPVAVPGVGGEAVEVTDTVVESGGRSVVVLPCDVGCVERSVVPSVVVRPEGGRVEPDEVCGRVPVTGGIVPVGGGGVPVEPVAVPGVGGEAVEVSETVVESGGRSVVVLPCEVGCVERSVVPSVVVRPEGGWVEPDEVCGRVTVAGGIVPVGGGGVPVEPVAVPGVGGEAVEVTDTVVESGGRSVVVLPCDVGCVERSVVPSVVVRPEGGWVEPDEVCGRVPVAGGIVLVGGGGVPVEPVAVPGVGGEAVEVTDTVVESVARSVVVLPCDVGCVERSVVPSVVVRPEGGRVEPDEVCGRVTVAGGIVPVGGAGVPVEPVAVPGVGGEAVEVTDTVVESGGRSVVVLPCDVGCVERSVVPSVVVRPEGGWVEPDEVCGRVTVAGGIVPVGGGGVPVEPVAVPGVGGEAVEVTDTVVESGGRSVVVLPCDVGCVERSVVPSVVVRPEGGRVEPDEVCGRVTVAGGIVPVGGGGVPVEPVAVPGVGGEAVEVTDTVVESVGRSVVVLPCDVGCVERSVVPSVVVRPEGGRVEPDEVCGRVPVTGGIVPVGGGGVPVEPVAVPGVGGEAVEVSETVVESGGRSVVVLPCEVGCVERSVVPSVVVRPEGGRVEPDEVCGRVPVAGRIVPVGGGGVPGEPVAVPGVGGEAVEVTDTVVESGGRSVVVLPCDVGCVERSVVPSVVVRPEGGRVKPDEGCGRVPVGGGIVPVGGGGVPGEPVAVPGVGGEAVEVTETVVESGGRSVVVLSCDVGCVERSVVPSVVVCPEGGRVEPDEGCGRVPVTGGIVPVGGGGVPVEPVAVPGVGGEAVEVTDTVVETGGRSVVVSGNGVGTSELIEVVGFEIVFDSSEVAVTVGCALLVPDGVDGVDSHGT